MKYSKVLIIGGILASLFIPNAFATSQGLSSTDFQESNYVSVPNKAKLDQALKQIADYKYKLSETEFKAFLNRLLVKIQTLKQKYNSTSTLRLQLQYLEYGIMRIKNSPPNNNNDNDDILCNLGFCDDNGDGTGTDATCGSANGQSFTSVPTSNLCATGNATRVSGNGPWTWTCIGLDGGGDVNCSAYASSYSNNGSCGSANGVTTSSQPTSGLCSVGSATSVTGSGPWYWTCNGINGGSSISCSAPYSNTSGNASCGSAHTNTFINAPTYGLCNSGYASSISGSGPWYWTCQSSYGNYTVNCRASYSGNSSNTAKCGSSNGQTYSSRPTSGLCDNGYASSVSGSGPWYWTCYGNNDSYVSCSASYSGNNQYASCGYANGQTYSARPTSGLCDSGYASTVSGSGPWYWTCNGSNGRNISCTAYTNNQDSYASCGYANGKNYYSKPTSGLCESGYASSVSGSGPWYWTCNDSNGRNVSCTAYYSYDNEDAMCGSANGQTFYSKPTSNLCKIGNVSAVSGTGPWYWSCTTYNGSNHETTASCSAYYGNSGNTYGKCGDANGKTYYSKPTTGLCESGDVTDVSGNGPWYWSCRGTDGNSASCIAYFQDSNVNNGKCGSSHGQSFTYKPTINLCETGNASVVSGNGPWYWSCHGINGGKIEYCSAQYSQDSSNDGKCGSAHGQTFSSQPTTNLCEIGNASVVSGNGPWYWSCSGTNGGKATYCSTQYTHQPYEPKCGPANGKSLPFKPVPGLCDSGFATEVLGDGPWTRNCRSLNGQLVSCTAKKLTCPIRIQIQGDPNETFRCQD